jgi:hypothetical protein
MANVKDIPTETEDITLRELRSMLEGVINHIEGKTISLSKFNDSMVRYSRREESKGSRRSAKARTRTSFARG